MKYAGMKTADDVIAPDGAAGIQKFTSALRKLVAVPKSAVEGKSKRRTHKKK